MIGKIPGNPPGSQGKKAEHLEVISREDRSTFDERRHLPRLCLTSEQFRISSTGKIFSVTDLSEGGMGLWCLDREDIRLFAVGKPLEGTLNLKRVKFAVRARVRSINRDRIGCQFENLSETLTQALVKFLDPTALGVELKPIPANELSTLWYHGPSGTDLLLRRLNDGQYERLTLYVLGGVVQWEVLEGLSTGRTVLSQEQSELRGILRFETLLVEKDVQPDPGKLAIAKKVILSSNIPQELKSWCLRRLER